MSAKMTAQVSRISELHQLMIDSYDADDCWHCCGSYGMISSRNNNSNDNNNINNNSSNNNKQRQQQQQRQQTQHNKPFVHRQSFD